MGACNDIFRGAYEDKVVIEHQNLCTEFYNQELKPMFDLLSHCSDQRLKRSVWEALINHKFSLTDDELKSESSRLTEETIQETHRLLMPKTNNQLVVQSIRDVNPSYAKHQKEIEASTQNARINLLLVTARIVQEALAAKAMLKQIYRQCLRNHAATTELAELLG